MQSPLKDKWIVVTRATHQSAELVNKLREADAHVIEFPLLEIHPTKNITETKQKLAKISQYQLIIFVSANAVDHCIKLISPEAFKDLKIVAVGKKTALRLKEHGLQVCCSPQAPYNSEALLALPELTKLDKTSNVDGHKGKNANKVAIIRGEGGRDLLKTRLETQGVNVDYINVYRRSCPQKTLEELTSFHDQDQLDIILVTSMRSASNLFQLQANYQHKWLNDVSLMAGSDRIAQQIQLKTSHSGKLHSAQDPSDETLYQELLLWAKNITNTDKPNGR